MCVCVCRESLSSPRGPVLATKISYHGVLSYLLSPSCHPKGHLICYVCAFFYFFLILTTLQGLGVFLTGRTPPSRERELIDDEHERVVRPPLQDLLNNTHDRHRQRTLVAAVYRRISPCPEISSGGPAPLADQRIW